MKIILINLLKFFNHFITIGDGHSSPVDRAESFITTGVIVGSTTVFSTVLIDWYIANQTFILSTITAIFLNMILGGWMHWQDGSFKLVILQNKTVAMVLGVVLVYLVLEMVISHAGDSLVAHGFRNALQVTTLLYPSSKVLKNVFIITKGEYPPRWIMTKIFNFQENGDLKTFVDKTPNNNGIN